jgi:hypothetical protein
VKERDPRGLSLASDPPARRRVASGGWNHWRKVWAAWCPTCGEETMPFPSGRCAFCDTHLHGQPTRGPYDPPLTGAAAGSLAPAEDKHETILTAA